MNEPKITKDLDNKVLIIEHVFDAPKAKLWNAFSNKDAFSAWWGPEGWTTTVKEFNFTPGGRNHYGMRCNDENQDEWFGKESWGLMKYESITEPDRFSYKDYFSDKDGNIQADMPTITMTIELVEEAGKTRTISRCQGETAEDIEKLVAMGMVEGFSSSVNKLAKLLTV